MRISHIASSLPALLLFGTLSCDGSQTIPTECVGVQADRQRPAGPYDLEWFVLVRDLVENDRPPARCPEIRDAYFKWIRGQYEGSVVGLADIEERMPCGCREGGELVRLRWRWRVPEVVDGEDTIDAYLTDTSSPSGIIEVWPANIRLPSGTSCSSSDGQELDPADHPVAIRLEADSPVRAPAWGIDSEADLQAIIAAERPTRAAPDFAYDNVCVDAEPGSSPPVFGYRFDDVVP